MNEQETAVAVHRFMSDRDQLARHLGIELVEVRPGYARTTMRMAPHLTNGHGILHGAAVFALADVAFAAACNSSGQTALALSMDIHFVATPKPVAVLTAVAEEIRRGGRTALCRMTVTDDEENLIAELHGMAYRKGENFLDTEGTE